MWNSICRVVLHYIPCVILTESYIPISDPDFFFIGWMVITVMAQIIEEAISAYLFPDVHMMIYSVVGLCCLWLAKYNKRKKREYEEHKLLFASTLGSVADPSLIQWAFEHLSYDERLTITNSEKLQTMFDEWLVTKIPEE